MFVKPSSAFVGKPSLVASSSGSAKKARYARLLPSTRNNSESRIGASSRSSSTPVSVFGDIGSDTRGGPGGTCADPVARIYCPAMGSDHELVGKVGRVTGEIDPGRLGEVMVPVRGGTEAFYAYAVDPKETIPKGTR